MNKTATIEVNDWVRYLGLTRANRLSGKIGQVVSVRCNDETGEAISYGVAYAGIQDLIWASTWAWDLVTKAEKSKPEVKTFDVDELFGKAAGGPVAVAKAEIARLESRIAELKAAVKVIESL